MLENVLQKLCLWLFLGSRRRSYRIWWLRVEGQCAIPYQRPRGRNPSTAWRQGTEIMIAKWKHDSGCWCFSLFALNILLTLLPCTTIVVFLGGVFYQWGKTHWPAERCVRSAPQPHSLQEGSWICRHTEGQFWFHWDCKSRSGDFLSLQVERLTLPKSQACEVFLIIRWDGLDEF